MGRIRGSHSKTFSADLENLALLRQFVEETALDLGAEPALVEDLILAVTEATTNIVVHGYNGRTGVIQVHVDGSDDALAVTLRDYAPQFDPTTVPAPDLDAPLSSRTLGGVGVFLMRELVDEVEYRRLPDGENVLLLVKNLKTEQSR